MDDLKFLAYRYVNQFLSFKLTTCCSFIAVMDIFILGSNYEMLNLPGSPSMYLHSELFICFLIFSLKKWPYLKKIILQITNHGPHLPRFKTVLSFYCRKRWRKIVSSSNDWNAVNCIPALSGDFSYKAFEKEQCCIPNLKTLEGVRTFKRPATKHILFSLLTIMNNGPCVSSFLAS